ncbi:hypothetical protein B0O99DRAFT_595507 [Bisporella sp. PMI_857]|nr:hypothetical protein B0O99DRAFT_595507 [Bisporella sp. PMI_857]
MRPGTPLGPGRTHGHLHEIQLYGAHGQQLEVIPCQDAGPHGGLLHSDSAQPSLATPGQQDYSRTRSVGPQASEDDGSWPDTSKEEDYDDAMLTKRRKTSLGISASEYPSKLSATSTSSQKRGSILSNIFAPVKGFTRGLRIDVSSIYLDSPTKVESSNFMNGKQQFDIKCVCQLAIHFKNQSFSGMQVDTTEVYKRCKQCILRTATNSQAGSVERKLVSLDPFLIEIKEICVNKRELSLSGEFQRSFELADTYYFAVKLEAEGMQKDWPPFDISLSDGVRVGSIIAPGMVTDLVTRGTAGNSDLHFYSQAKDVLKQDQQNSSTIKLCWGKAEQAMKNEAGCIAYRLRMPRRSL